MDKDAAFQDLQTKNTYLQQQLEQREHREQIIAQKAVTTSAVSINIFFFFVIYEKENKGSKSKFRKLLLLYLCVLNPKAGRVESNIRNI